MRLPSAFIFLTFVSISLASEVYYVSEVVDEWKKGIPVLRDFRCRFDLSLNIFYSYSHRNLNTIHLKPCDYIFLPVSVISNILKAHEQLAKVGVEYDGFFNEILPEMASVNAAKQIIPSLLEHWNKVVAQFDHDFPAFIQAMYSNSSVDPKKTPLINEVFDLFRSKNRFQEQLNQVLTEGNKKSNLNTHFHIERTASLLERAENILIETSTQIGNTKTSYQKRNHSKEMKHLLAGSIIISGKHLDLLKSWNKHLLVQMMIVEYQTALHQNNVDGIECYRTRYNLKPLEILDKFIGAAVRKRLQNLCETKTEDLPLPISLQIMKMENELLQSYSMDNLDKLQIGIKELGLQNMTLEFYNHLIRIGNKAYKYGILLRNEMLKVFNEYTEKINKALSKTILAFGLLGLPSKTFFDLLSNLKIEFTKFREDTAKQIQALETAELNEKVFPIIDKVLEKKHLLEREVEFRSSVFLASVEHFQHKMSSEIHELAQQLVLCSSNNENNLLMPFDSANESFEQYVNRTVPKINEVIKKLRNEPFSQEIKAISQDQVVPDICSEDSDNALEVESRVFLKEYLDFPLLCVLDQSQISGPSFVSKNEILVGTFNTEWLFPFPDSVSEDGVGSYIWGSERAAARHFSSIVEAIESINADILLLQEVQDCRVLSAIVDALKQKGITDYSAYLVQTKDVTLGHHLGILSRYKPTEVSFAENTISKNIFARFHFINENGEEAKIAIMGVHMIAGENEGKRNMQALSIASFLEENLQQDERLLIMGDMNDYDSRVKGHGPYSSCLEILSHSRNALINPPKSYVLINPLVKVRGKNLQTQSQRGIVDHILGEKDLNFRRPKIHSKLVWGVKGSVSDHAPVTVEIRPFLN